MIVDKSILEIIKGWCSGYYSHRPEVRHILSIKSTLSSAETTHMAPLFKKNQILYEPSGLPVISVVLSG